MKWKLCMMTLLTIGIVAALVFFFEQREARTADVFEGILIYIEQPSGNLW